MCDGLDGDTFWLVAQRGRSAGWVRNIEANPRVRVKVHGKWRAGTAHILDDDDPLKREERLGQGNLPRRFCLRTSRATSTGPPISRPSANGKPRAGCFRQMNRAAPIPMSIFGQPRQTFPVSSNLMT